MKKLTITLTFLLGLLIIGCEKETDCFICDEFRPGGDLSGIPMGYDWTQYDGAWKYEGTDIFCYDKPETDWSGSDLPIKYECKAFD